jgi:hypothetical protein
MGQRQAHRVVGRRDRGRTVCRSRRSASRRAVPSRRHDLVPHLWRRDGRAPKSEDRRALPGVLAVPGLPPHAAAFFFCGLLRGGPPRVLAAGHLPPRSRRGRWVPPSGASGAERPGSRSMPGGMVMRPQTFPIRGAGAPIHTLAEWFQLAPPAGRTRQWREGRSALELARRWVAGRVPDEVSALLATAPAFRDFEPLEGLAEARTPLDRLAGNTRNHDLLVVGRAGGLPALLDVEGKADERFGPTISQRVAAAHKARTLNPRSRALERVETLCLLVFGVGPNQVGELRYQLLHAVAASVLAARRCGATRVAWVAHEFRSAAVRSALQRANARDLDMFVTRLAGSGMALPSSGALVGPLSLHGPDAGVVDVELYIGKAVCNLAEAV